jgi:hypothetical protein
LCRVLRRRVYMCLFEELRLCRIAEDLGDCAEVRRNSGLKRFKVFPVNDEHFALAEAMTSNRLTTAAVGNFPVLDC